MPDREPSRRALLRAAAAVCAAVAAACTRSRPAHHHAASASTVAPSATPAPPVAPAASGASSGTSAATAPQPPVSSPRSAAVVPSGPAHFVPNGPRHLQQVALTFHGSGDPALAEALLHAVETAHAQVTIFAVGQWLAQHPSMAVRITGSGHELANHTWSHPSLGRLSEDQVRSEITRCRDQIAAHGATAPGFFRPSAMRTPTPRVLRAAAAAGYRTVVGYDVDTLDFTDPGASTVRRLAATARAGSIVSLHLGHAGTVAAIGGILADLTSRGLSPVTVSTLLRA
ncbi:MAG: hypothetical protein QOG49_1170 [Frankiaceae bacterium]|nr:hypothetical protein [Frankiaceae bacterium]